MGAGSGMPPRTSSDARGTRLESASAKIPRPWTDLDARHALLVAPDRPRADVSAGVAGLGRGAWPRTRVRCQPALVHARSAGVAGVAASGSSRRTERGVSAVLDAPLPENSAIEAVEAPPYRRPRCGRAGSRVGEVYVETPVDEAFEDRGSTTSPSTGCARRSDAAGAVVPSDAALAGFVRACRERGLVFKATAGLHHAVRSNGEHGFLNLLAAVVFAGDEEAALAETDSAAFALDADGVRRGRRASALPTSSLACGASCFHSIGSCSFFEPVEELLALGMLPVVTGAVGFGVFSVGGDAPRVGFRVGRGSARPRRRRPRRGVRARRR